VIVLKKISDEDYLEPCDWCYFNMNGDCIKPDALSCNECIYVEIKPKIINLKRG
jgi:hypothetical protein